MSISPKTIFQRIVFDAALLVSALMFPLWCALALAFVGLFLFEQFYEIVLLGLMIDAVYGVPLPLLHLPALYTIFASALFLLALPLRKRIRYYRAI